MTGGPNGSHVDSTRSDHSQGDRQQVPVTESSAIVSVTNSPVVDWKAPLFFFILGCLFAIVPIINAKTGPKINKDYTLWHTWGRRVLAGESIYPDVGTGEPEFMYPPTAAVLFYAPASVFEPVIFVAIMAFISAASWGFCSWAAHRLICGAATRRTFVWSILPGLAVAPYVWDIQLLGQMNLFLLALTLGSFVASRYRHPMVAGGLFSAAASLKVFPLPAIAYYVVCRKWMTVIATLVGLWVFLWFLTGLVRGFERNTTELKRWATLMLGDQSGTKMSGRTTIGFSRRNQSLISVSHRLLRHVEAGDNPHKPLYVNVTNVSPHQAQLVGFGLCALLGAILLLACRFHFAPSPECEGLEIAMVCTLVPLCSPLAWTYFFCWLLPGWTALCCWYQNPRLSVRAQRILTGGIIVAGLLLASAVTEQIDPTLQACGVTAWGTVVMFLSLAFVRSQLPNSVDGLHHA